MARPTLRERLDHATSVLTGKHPLISLCAVKRDNIDEIRAVLMYASGNSAATAVFFDEDGSATTKKEFCSAYRMMQIHLRDETAREDTLRKIKLVYTGPLRELLANIGLSVGSIAAARAFFKIASLEGIDPSLRNRKFPDAIAGADTQYRAASKIANWAMIYLCVGMFLHSLIPRFGTKLKHAIAINQTKDDAFAESLEVRSLSDSINLAKFRAHQNAGIPAFVFVRPDGRLRSKNVALAYLDAYYNGRVPEYVTTV